MSTTPPLLTIAVIGDDAFARGVSLHFFDQSFRIVSVNARAGGEAAISDASRAAASAVAAKGAPPYIVVTRGELMAKHLSTHGAFAKQCIVYTEAAPSSSSTEPKKTEYLTVHAPLDGDFMTTVLRGQEAYLAALNVFAGLEEAHKQTKKLNETLTGLAGDLASTSPTVGGVGTTLGLVYHDGTNVTPYIVTFAEKGFSPKVCTPSELSAQRVCAIIINKDNLMFADAKDAEGVNAVNRFMVENLDPIEVEADVNTVVRAAYFAVSVRLGARLDPQRLVAVVTGSSTTTTCGDVICIRSKKDDETVGKFLAFAASRIKNVATLNTEPINSLATFSSGVRSAASTFGKSLRDALTSSS
jgi:hypothetical protein